MKQSSPVKHPYFQINKKMHSIPKEIWHHIQMEVKKIQSITLGEGGKVAVIDSGIDERHKEIIGKIIDKVDKTREGKMGGDHGTFVAGEIAGTNVGLFPSLKIGDFKALTSKEGLGDSSWVTACIVHAMKSGYEVINASLGSNMPDKEMETAIRNFCSDPKRFFVAAAGNDGRGTTNETTIDYPAAWAWQIDGVIAVGAIGVDKKGNLYIPTWSSRGNVKIVLPGVDIVGILPDGQYGIMSGTSMATPLASALIAACKVVDPMMTHEKFRDALINTTTDVLTPGRDGVSGYGLVHAYNLLKWVNDNKTNAVKEPVIEPKKPKTPKKRRNFSQWLKIIFG